MRHSLLLAALLCTGLVACRSRHDESAAAQPANPANGEGDGGASSQPRLPDDDAGRLVARAIDAAGGWEAWKQHRDVSFVSTLTLFDPLGNAISDSIFLQEMPLHQGIKIRLESIGMNDEVLFGFDGDREWMLHDGHAVSEPSRIAFTRFHALSSAYWFALPFVLAELPAELTFLGSEDDGGKKLDKLRVGYADSVPVPFDWLVIYFDASTARIDRIHVHALAEFLQHSLWVGIWDDDRQAAGIRFDRRRAFFPADAAGGIVGPMAAEQLVEHVDFDRGFAPEIFSQPEKARDLTAEIPS